MGSANRCAPCSYKWKGDSEYGNIIICPAKRTGKVSGIISAFGWKGAPWGKRADHGSGELYRQHGPTVWEGAEGIKNGQAPCEKTGGTGV